MLFSLKIINKNARFSQLTHTTTIMRFLSLFCFFLSFLLPFFLDVWRFFPYLKWHHSIALKSIRVFNGKSRPSTTHFTLTTDKIWWNGNVIQNIHMHIYSGRESLRFINETGWEIHVESNWWQDEMKHELAYVYVCFCRYPRLNWILDVHSERISALKLNVKHFSCFCMCLVLLHKRSVSPLRFHRGVARIQWTPTHLNHSLVHFICVGVRFPMLTPSGYSWFQCVFDINNNNNNHNIYPCQRMVLFC